MTQALHKKVDKGADLVPVDPARASLEVVEAGPPATLQPVPRITVHAFCINPETGLAVQRAAEDRRLKRASVLVEMGGIDAACARYSDSPTPNLVLLEASSDPEDILRGLDRLAEQCDSGTRVIVIGSANDVRLYRDLMRRGVSEYLMTPVDPLQVIEAVSSLYVDPSAPPIGRSIVFVGAKGGVGASTVCHNAGYALASLVTEQVTIVDLDLAFGTASLDFNQDASHGLADALTAPDRLDPVMLDRLLVECSSNLNLLVAPSALGRDYDLPPDSYEMVLDVVRRSVPYMLVDLPHLWSSWAKQMLLSAEEVVVVAMPDLACLRNTKNLFEEIMKARPNDRPPHLVLNQVGMPKRPEIAVKDFAEALGQGPLVELAFDPQLFGTAANNGQMITELNGKAAPVAGFDIIARRLLGRELPAASTKAGLLSFLMGKKAR
ncbi:MAG: AAA family ATPase [Alphaproteobacteria bacterium]|nr:AAA family ATPase [Alphaproteobacteria bacterium]